MVDVSEAEDSSAPAGMGRRTAATRLLKGATAGLLVLCWLLGGVTQDSTSADELLQLLALPVLVLAVAVLSRRPLSGVTGVAVIFASALVALPAFQLLSLPAGLGLTGEVRQGIVSDLASAGATLGVSHATLSGFATERALWSLMPALAVFLGALALPTRDLRGVLKLVLVLALGSALFAFFQLSLPDGSPLLLYTQWGRNFGGLFNNTNHQGIALTIGAVIAAALFMQGRRRARDGRQPRALVVWVPVRGLCRDGAAGKWQRRDVAGHGRPGGGVGHVRRTGLARGSRPAQWPAWAGRIGGGGYSGIGLSAGVAERGGRSPYLCPVPLSRSASSSPRWAWASAISSPPICSTRRPGRRAGK